jgi:uncharacterized repeat protein (TIGR01451 family)
MHRRPIKLQWVLVGVLALSMLLMALPVAWAGDSDSSLSVRSLGACTDTAGLGYRAFGLGTDSLTGGTFNVTGIPVGATIAEAWLYWNGADTGNSPNDDPLTFNPATDDGDPTITLNGNQVPMTTSSRIGGPAFWETARFSYAYASNVTSLVTGNGSYVLAGMNNLNVYNNGAELLVVYRDPALSPRYVGIAEGMDLAEGHGGPASGANTSPVVYQFNPAQVSRTADLTVFLGGAGSVPTGQSSLWYKVGSGAPPTTSNLWDVGGTEISNPFTGLVNQNSNGFWDSYATSVTIAADATWLAVQVESKDVNSDEIEWVGAVMNTPLACPVFTVSKTRVLPADGIAKNGDQVQFRIDLTNTGNTTLTTVPVTDTYSTTFLTYGYGGVFSIPASVNNVDDGTLNWSNLGPVTPTQSKSITVNFTAKAGTQSEPGDLTTNTSTPLSTSFVTVSGVTDGNGVRATDRASSAVVEIGNPAFTVSKTLLTPADGSTKVGQEIVFRLTIVNTGDTILNTVPVADTYDTIYLQYGYGGVYSVPASNDNTDDGALNWSNVGPVFRQAQHKSRSAATRRLTCTSRPRPARRR